MKREVVCLLLKLGHNFISWQCSATSCQNDTAEYKNLLHPTCSVNVYGLHQSDNPTQPI